MFKEYGTLPNSLSFWLNVLSIYFWENNEIQYDRTKILDLSHKQQKLYYVVDKAKTQGGSIHPLPRWGYEFAWTSKG